MLAVDLGGTKPGDTIMDGIDHNGWIISAIFSAVTVAIAWLGKEILKPWSDAALMRSRAFVAYVESQGVNQTTLVEESKKQTLEAKQQNAMLLSLDAKTDRGNKTLEELTGAGALCKSQGCQAEQMAGIIVAKLEELLGKTDTKKTDTCPGGGQCNKLGPKA